MLLVQSACDVLLDSSIMDPSRETLHKPGRNENSTSRRRKSIRVFFSVAVAVILLDVIPPSWPGVSQPKRWLSSLLNRVGLWQGQWAMFAPNPIINNAYLTAEIEDEVGNQTYWDSPDWKSVGTFGKFYRFRYLNFYNRIYLDSNAPAINDFVDYLARTASGSPVRRLKLVRNAMTMLAPEAGSLPTGDDVIWISRSDLLRERRYEPR